MTDDDLAFAGRVRSAVSGMLAALPQQVRDELAALSVLGDEADIGVRFHPDDDHPGWFWLTWTGRVIGAAYGPWLADGIAPDCPPPVAPPAALAGPGVA